MLLRLTWLIHWYKRLVRVGIWSYIQVVCLALPLLVLILPQDAAYWYGLPLFWLWLSFLAGVSLIWLRPRSSPRIVVGLWVGFLGFAWASGLLSVSRYYSVVQLITWQSILVYALLVRWWLGSDSGRQLYGVVLLGIAVLISSLSLVLRYLPGIHVEGINLFFLTHGHINSVDYIVLVLPLALSGLLAKNSWPVRLVYALVLAILLAASLFSLSRAGYLLLSLEIAIGGYWLGRSFKSKLSRVAITSLGLLLLGFGYVIFLRPQIDTSGAINLNQWQRPWNVSPRLAYWGQAIEAFRDRPWLGFGPGTFRLVSQRFHTQAGEFSHYAHNHLSQLLAETGWVAAALWLLAVLVGLVRGWRLQPITPWRKAIIVGLVSSLLLAMIDFSFDFVLVSAVFWSLLLLLQPETKLGSSRLGSHLLLISSISLMLAGSCLQFWVYRPEAGLITWMPRYAIQWFEPLLLVERESSLKTTQKKLSWPASQWWFPADPEIRAKFPRYMNLDEAQERQLYRDLIEIDPRQALNYYSILLAASVNHDWSVWVETLAAKAQRGFDATPEIEQVVAYLEQRPSDTLIDLLAKSPIIFSRTNFETTKTLTANILDQADSFYQQGLYDRATLYYRSVAAIEAGSLDRHQPKFLDQSHFTSDQAKFIVSLLALPWGRHQAQIQERGVEAIYTVLAEARWSELETEQLNQLVVEEPWLTEVSGELYNRLVNRYINQKNYTEAWQTLWVVSVLGGDLTYEAMLQRALVLQHLIDEALAAEALDLAESYIDQLWHHRFEYWSLLQPAALYAFTGQPEKVVPALERCLDTFVEVHDRCQTYRQNPEALINNPLVYEEIRQHLQTRR